MNEYFYWKLGLIYFSEHLKGKSEKIGRYTETVDLGSLPDEYERSTEVRVIKIPLCSLVVFIL